MSNLTDKEIKFIDAYFTNKNITDTCKALKISRNTAYNYLKDTRIKEEIDKRRFNLLNDTTMYLQNNLQECSKVLMDIVKDQKTSPQIKVNAINSIFSNCNKLTETNDILTKLADIEERLNQQERGNINDDSD